jgi:CheY-like chemotaxis protein
VDGADSLRILLGLYGHDVRVANSGPEGLRVAAKWLPQVVLCDIGLPGLDGWAVARSLRAGPGTSAARLFALTAYCSEADRRRSREAGFDAHLVMPVDLDELLGLLGP